MALFIMSSCLEQLVLMECPLCCTTSIHPTRVIDIKGSKDVSPKIAIDKNMQMRAFKGFDVPAVEDLLDSRIPVLTNSDVTLHLSRPKNLSQEYFYKNVDADEVIFIHEGRGSLKTQVGVIDFSMVIT
jgi:homogentisate 1,2-dioxygenase